MKLSCPRFFGISVCTEQSTAQSTARIHHSYKFLPWRSTHILFIFIAWFNLDLSIETCFFEGLDAYHKTWLQFLFPLYIWSISGLIIILSKYSRRIAKVMGNNSVPVLATLFLLSYAKLLRIIISALSYTVLYTSVGHKRVWSADGNVDYILGPKAYVFICHCCGNLVFSPSSIYTHPLSWSEATYVP